MWCGWTFDCCVVGINKRTEKVKRDPGIPLMSSFFFSSFSLSDFHLFFVFHFSSSFPLVNSYLTSLYHFALLLIKLASPASPFTLPSLLLHSFPLSLSNHPPFHPPFTIPYLTPPFWAIHFVPPSLPPFLPSPTFLLVDYTSGLLYPASSSYSIPLSHYVLCMCLCVIRHTRPGLSSLMNKLQYCVLALGTCCSF